MSIILETLESSRQWPLDTLRPHDRLSGVKMIILLVLYIIFLVIYIAFNIYGIFRVWSMRIDGDATARIIIIYLFVISAIIFISLTAIATLNWSTNLNFLNFGG